MTTPLASGARVGPYEIVAAVGSGAMGDVYRARDTRLNRDVALKVLHGAFSERVEREARAVAALNHPNICVLHDVGPNYLVMELVEGQTLADRIESGALPVDEALAVAVQIADALDAAHDKGVVHRDLKPANIKIRSDGTIKVLDFGLAKLGADSAAPASGGSEAATMALDVATQPGTVLGTPAYMAPEQARGQVADKRADIWAFGVVLYEMLTGRRPFRGATISDTLAAILTSEVDWTALPAGVPAGARRVLRRCLERDVRRRLHDIADARIDLEDRDEPLPAILTTRHSGWKSPLLWMGALACIAIGGALVSLLSGRTSGSPAATTRWTVTISAPRYGGTGVALSRDGAWLAYAESAGGQPRIMLRRVDQPDAHSIAGTDGGVRPFFSPDGQWIAYFSTNPWQLRKAPVAGGTSVALAPANFLGGTWGDDGTLVFTAAGDSGGGLMRVAANGGTAEALTAPDASKGETSHQWPQFLPGGKYVLFTIDTNAAGLDARRVAVLDLQTRKYVEILSGGSEARYVPDGRLVYVRGGTMYAVPFDASSRKVTGAETAVISDVFYNAERGFADYSFSDSGLLVYVAENRAAAAGRLESVDRNGVSRPLALKEQPFSDLSFSPDGQHAVIAIRNPDSGNSDLWLLDLEREALRRLTSEGNNSHPLWSPDGRRIVFRSRRDVDGVYWMDADSSSKARIIYQTEVFVVPTSWTADGRILFASAATGHGQIFVLTLRPDGTAAAPVPFLTSVFDDTGAVVSPDRRWVAYASDESGKNQIYVRSIEGTGVIPISSNGGETPHWTRGGKELLYRDLAQNEIMSVDVDATSTFHASRPRPVLSLPGAVWDVTPDGARFLVVRSPESADTGARLRVVTNWFEELRKLVPSTR